MCDNQSFYKLNFSFFEFHNGFYDTFVIEYKNRTVLIKIQEDTRYTFVDNNMIIVDLYIDELCPFFLNMKNKDYETISMYCSH
jgi:hypothetical protein